MLKEQRIIRFETEKSIFSDRYLNKKRFSKMLDSEYKLTDKAEKISKSNLPFIISKSNFKNLSHNMTKLIFSYLTFKEVHYLISNLKNSRLVKFLHSSFYTKLLNPTIKQTQNFDVSFCSKMFGNQFRFAKPFKNFVTFLQTHSHLSRNNNTIDEQLGFKDILYIQESKTVVIVFSRNSLIIKKESKFSRLQFTGKSIIRVIDGPGYRRGKYIFVHFSNEIRAIHLENLSTDFCYKIESNDLIYTNNPGALVVLTKKGGLMKFRDDEEKLFLFDCELLFNKKKYQNMDMRIFPEFNEKLMFILLDNSIQILNIDLFNFVGTLEGHTDSVIDIFFSKRYFTMKDILISVSKSHEVRIWNLTEALCIKSFELGSKYIFDRIIYVPEIRNDCLFVCKNNQNPGLFFLRGLQNNEQKENYITLEIYNKHSENLVNPVQERIIYSYVNSCNNLSKKLVLKLFGLSNKLILREYILEIN